VDPVTTSWTNLLGLNRRIRLASGLAALLMTGSAWAQDIGKRATEPPAPEPTPSALVHIEVEGHVELEARSIEYESDWAPVCDSPCDKRLPLDNEYRITGGEHFRRSGAFTLHAQDRERVVLRVNRSNVTGIVGGVLLIVLGAPATAIGGLVAFVGLAFHDGSATAGGGVVAVVGSLGIVGGALMIHSGGRSQVEQAHVRDDAAALKNAGSVGAREALPRVVGVVPIVRLEF
jgi:hypothetical protein